MRVLEHKSDSFYIRNCLFLYEDYTSFRLDIVILFAMRYFSLLIIKCAVRCLCVLWLIISYQPIMSLCISFRKNIPSY